MAGDAARARDPRFPNLAPDVVAGYLDAPSTMCAEIIDGALSLMPRPRPRHARAAGKLLASLDGPFDRGGEGPGGWVFLPEPELHLGAGPDIVTPDLAGWHRARFPVAAFDDDAPAALTVAPDWLCEVLSPRTEAYDRGPSCACIAARAWAMCGSSTRPCARSKCFASKARGTLSSTPGRATAPCVPSPSTPWRSRSPTCGASDPHPQQLPSRLQGGHHRQQREHHGRQAQHGRYRRRRTIRAKQHRLHPRRHQQPEGGERVRGPQRARRDAR